MGKNKIIMGQIKLTEKQLKDVLTRITEEELQKINRQLAASKDND